MKQLIKANNSDLSFRLKLNYNNVYSRLRMLLGAKSSFFADISPKSLVTTWYAEDDGEYLSIGDAPKSEMKNITASLRQQLAAVRKELSAAPEIADYVDDIIEIPDQSYVFYQKVGADYNFVLAGWGCKFAHQNASDSNASFIRRISKNPDEPETSVNVGKGKDVLITDTFSGSQQDKMDKSDDILDVPYNLPNSNALRDDEIEKKEINNAPPKQEGQRSESTQNVIVRVLDKNNNPVKGEIVLIHTKEGDKTQITTDDGCTQVGKLPYGDSFSVTFPNINSNQERTFEVEPNVEYYDAFVKKMIKYSPVLFVEDQHGNPVQDYNVKIIIGGQETVYNSGLNGVIQLPIMQEGQTFIAVDTANYANTEEYNITQTEAKAPYHFHIRRVEKSKVGITVIDKSGATIPNALVDLIIGDIPCHQTTAEDGRAEFPYNVFREGEIPVILSIKQKGKVKSVLNFVPDNTEYTIRLQDGKKPFEWKWFALLPLMLLFGYGGYMLYEWYSAQRVPTIAEMEKGVVMTLSQTSYWVDLNVPDVTYGGVELKAFYFVYSPNDKQLLQWTFDENKKLWGPSTGTGFLISQSGLIATNRHIADPIAPESMSGLVKKFFQGMKDRCQTVIDSCSDRLRLYATAGMINEDVQKTRLLLNSTQNELKALDKVLNIGDFTVHSNTKVSVAFTGSHVDDCDELYKEAMLGHDLESYGFYKCSKVKIGEPGGVKENDVAIIKLNNSKRDIPDDAYIFTVPDVDVFDSKVPDDYEITVLGYNAGMNLQDMNLQDGIKPQAQHGKITNSEEKYRVAYDAPTLGGSSGSPVLNKDHKLVAINNSGYSQTQGFNYGVKTKYLKELLENIHIK